jgi:hypothetical protein
LKFSPRKKTLFILSIVFLLCVYFTRDSILSSGFQWYLKGYCWNCLEGKLSYEKINYENGQWILEQPILATKNSLQDGGYLFTAERAVIEASFSFFERKMDFAIFVHSLKGEIGKNTEHIKSKFIARIERFPLFHLHFHFDIQEAVVNIPKFDSEDSKNPEFIPLYFSILMNCRQTKECHATLSFSNLVGADKKIELSLADSTHSMPQLLCSFYEMDLHSLSHVLKLFCPQYVPMDLSKGIVNGEVSLYFPANEEPLLEGKIELSQLSLYHPLQKCSIQIPKLSLILERANAINSGVTLFCEVPKDASVQFFQKDQPFWTMRNLKGTLSMASGEQAKLQIEGVCLKEGRTKHLKLVGEAQFIQQGWQNVTLGLFLNGDNSTSEHSSLHLSARQVEDQWTFGEVELSSFNHDEFDLLQQLVKNYYPQINTFHFNSGSIDALMLFNLKDLILNEVKIEHFSAQQVKFSVEPWQLFGDVVHASGSLSFNLSDSAPVETLNAELNIAEGSLYLNDLDKAVWKLGHIHTQLCIRNGVIQKSLLKGMLAGLSGEIQLDGTRTDACLSVNLNGQAKDLALVLPESFLHSFRKNFANDELQVTAQVANFSNGFLVKGKLLINDNLTEQSIPFGFTLEKSSTLWGRPPSHPFTKKYFSWPGLESLQKIMPLEVIQTPLSDTHLTKHKSGIGGFQIKNGWFEADQLPLDKYLSSLIFQRNQIKLNGLGNFKGSFDEQRIIIHYDVIDLVLENEDFAIEVSQLSPQRGVKDPHVAVHYFDINKQKSFGTIPIYNGRYFEKNSGLLFTDIKTEIMLEDSTLHARDLQAFSNGVYFIGNVDIDWSAPKEGSFEVAILISEMDAKFSQVQQLFSHFEQPIFFLKLPIEGNVALNSNGGKIHFDFELEDYSLQSHLAGELTDAVLLCESFDLSLQEFGLNFEYDHALHTLEFSAIQGTLLLGGSNHLEEYILSGDKILFSDFRKNESEFDIWLEDKQKDILRIAGSTRSVFDQWGKTVIDFTFDPALCHFGEIYPSVFQMTMKEWLQVELFRLEFSFTLKNLLADFQRFSKSGFLFLSRPLLRELTELKELRGNFKTELHYDGSHSLFNYNILGDEIAVGKNQFKHFKLSGSKKEAVWSIDQIQLDEFSLAMDIQKETNIWNINFLGMRLGQSILVGLEGFYNETNSYLESRINLLELDLEKLNEWPVFQSMLEKYQLYGSIRAAGEMKLQFDKNLSKGMKADLLLNASLRDGKVKGLHLQDIENMQFRYLSDSGLSLHNVRTELKSNDANQENAAFFLENAQYNFTNHQLCFNEIKFSIPPPHLKWVAENLQEIMPTVITSFVAERLCSLKKTGCMSGAIKLSVSNLYSCLDMKLEDGAYQLFDRECSLSNFSLQYDPFALRVNFDCQYRSQPIHLSIFSEASTFEKGEVVLFDPRFKDVITKDSPLTIQWQMDPKQGYYIKKVDGNLSGIHANLIRDPAFQLSADLFALKGVVKIDLDQIQPFLEKEIAAKLSSWEVGKGYSLDGMWKFKKQLSNDLLDNISFQGDVLGEDFKFFGYQFSKLNAKLVYSKEFFKVQDLSVEDPAGYLQIDKAAFYDEGDGKWQATIPMLTIKQFRPYRLNCLEGSKKGIDKALVIRQMEFRNMHGFLNDRNSFAGEGNLFFAHSQKHSLQHPIFAIPAEILSRIGLDLAVLNPIRGKIEYQVKDGKLFLNRFKDVYSKGKMSKFYLAGGEQSYIDFDGNLHMQVRMKQYNLLFKLAELFTFTVQGTLKKPTFTLQKQQREGENAEKDGTR